MVPILSPKMIKVIMKNRQINCYIFAIFLLEKSASPHWENNNTVDDHNNNAEGDAMMMMRRVRMMMKMMIRITKMSMMVQD